LRVLAALKSELDDGGRDLAAEWSSRGSSYKPADFRATWKSLHAAGGVTIGTLFALAKAGGFVLPGANGGKRPRTAPAPERTAAHHAREQREAELRDKRRAATALEARRRFDAASETGAAPYLARKGVQAHGVRVEPDGTLLVPAFTIAGELATLQTIGSDGSKRFLPGGRASDVLHWLGAPDGAAALAIAEGYATAATVHEATRLPVACAFNAGNLADIARAVRQRFPGARLVICADDDRETEARRGHNPGRQAARDAAKVGNAVVAMPAPIEGRETDFNDLAQRAGLEAVAAIVHAAIERPEAPAAPTGAESENATAVANRENPADEAAGEDSFRITESGVYYLARDREGRTSRQWICGPLAVEARTRDAEGSSWGYLLAFDDPERTHKRIAVPGRLLAGDGAELRALLHDEGLGVAVGPARARLLHYIATRRPERFVRCVNTIGWHGENFVLPNRTFGASGESVFYQTEERGKVQYRTAGTLDAWREHVAKVCIGNPRLLFAVAAAFAGPCLQVVGELSGGFHFFGASSKGKTTLLRAAASVWGRPELGGYMRTWRSTANATEAVCAAHCDGLAVFDEVRECDPREIVATVLMVGNGTGKSRMRAGGALRSPLAWRLLFLSSGERKIAELAALAGLPVDAGAGVRLVEIPIGPDGAFDELHGAGDGAAFADRLRAAALHDYGATGVAWLEHLTARRADAERFLRDCTGELLAAWHQRGDAGQTQRVASRFALVAAAGELATRAELTGWPTGAAEHASRRLFLDWLGARGTRGDAEELAAVRQVAGLLGQHAESYFPWWHRAGDDHRPNAPKRWGLRKLLGWQGTPIETEQMRDLAIQDGHAKSFAAEFYVLASAFREDICRGFDPRYVARVLYQRGYLLPENEKRLDRKERLPGIGAARCYVIKPEIFDDDAL